MKPIGPDMRSLSVRAQQNMRTFDAMPWAPRPTINWRALGWALTALALCCAMLGLFTLGGK